MVVWQVVALEAARVARRCPRCDVVRPFVSSGRFRVNANGRRLDVWLIYRCAACDETWNFEVVSRATPEAIGAARLRAFHENDAAAALACAARGAEEVAFRVERPEIVMPAEIVLAVPRPCPVRLDRLLAGELGVSRGRVRAMVAEETAGALRRPIRDGQRVRLAERAAAP